MQSALAQDYDDFEVVVRDNASTDGTAQILAQFQDPRLRVVRGEETVDLPTNWRLLVQESRGSYIKLLCADDLIQHAAVRLQAKLLDTHEEVSLVGSRKALIDEEGRVLAAGLGLRGLVGLRSGHRIARRTVLSGGINPLGEPAGLMFRRRDYDAVGGWDDSLLYPMDLNLWINLLTRGEFFGQGEELAAFRISPTALSAAHSTQQYHEVKELVARIGSDSAWKLHRAHRVAGALACKVAWEAWPRRQQRMAPGEPWVF